MNSYLIIEQVTHHNPVNITFDDLRTALAYYFESIYPKQFFKLNEDGSNTVEREIELKELQRLKEKLGV